MQNEPFQPICSSVEAYDNAPKHGLALTKTSKKDNEGSASDDSWVTKQYPDLASAAEPENAALTAAINRAGTYIEECRAGSSAISAAV